MRSPICRVESGLRLFTATSRVRAPLSRTRETAASIPVGRLMSAGRMAEEERTGQNGADRIGDSLPCDVGRRAVDRLVETHAVAQRGGREHAERSGEYRGFIAQDVAEHVFGHQHVD